MALKAKKTNRTAQDEAVEELGTVLAGLFTVVRKGLAPSFESMEQRRANTHAGVIRVKEDIARGAGVAGEPFRP